MANEALDALKVTDSWISSHNSFNLFQINISFGGELCEIVAVRECLSHPPNGVKSDVY